MKYRAIKMAAPYPIVDAVVWHGDFDPMSDPTWLTEARAAGVFSWPAGRLDGSIEVNTPDGPRTAHKGDYLIKVFEGILHAQPALFQSIYVPAPEYQDEASE